MGQVRVSVIINTLDRAGSLERTLLSLRQLRYPDFEVVVVHGPCRDHTAELLARYAPTIRIGACPDANLSMSRNIGIAMARGDVLAFLDDDAIPEPDWLDRLVTGFRDPKIGSAGGFIRDHDGVRFQYRVIVADRFGEAEKFTQAPASLGRNRYLSPTGTNVALRRDALLAIRGFDEEYAYFLDETDVNLRLIDEGWQTAVVPDAEVHHKFAQNQIRGADRVPQSMYLIARSKAYFCWVNAVGRHSPAEIERNLRTFRAVRGRRLRNLHRKGRIDWQSLARLTAEIAEGLRDGARDAREQGGRSLLTKSLIANHQAEEFRPYPTPIQAETRLRVCFLSRNYPPFGNDETSGQVGGMARGLAALGHEVTVICASPYRHPFVEFADGVWVHGAVDNGFLARLRPNYRAAAAREVARAQPRRNFQLVCGPPTEAGPIDAIERRLQGIVAGGGGKTIYLEKTTAAA